NNRLRDLKAWLAYEKVVPANTKTALLVALGLLIVCLVNTTGLLLAKFLRRSAEIGVRRALGAPRRELYRQFLIEAGMVGVPGVAARCKLPAVADRSGDARRRRRRAGSGADRSGRARHRLGHAERYRRAGARQRVPVCPDLAAGHRRHGIGRLVSHLPRRACA